MARTALPCLVEESLGKQWYFSLSAQQAVEYAQRDNKTWSEAVQIDGYPVKLFSATIDNEDKIHLLAYNTSKQLIYYEWNGRQWYQKMLYRIASRFENISFLEILSTGSRIHLFYYIENSLKRAEETLIHSYMEDGKWKSEILLNFLTDQVVAPQLVRSDDKGNVFCVYTRTIRSQTRCYFIRFDNKSAAWSKPAIIFQRPGKCSNFDGETDSNGNLHMVWIEEAGSDYRLNYAKINPSALSYTNAAANIHEGTAPIQYPCIHADKDLLCFWSQNGKVMASRGNYTSQSWEFIDEITAEPINPYIRISKSLDGKARIRSELGDGYPGFEWTVETLLLGYKDNKDLTRKSAYDDEPDRGTEKRKSSSMVSTSLVWKEVQSLSEHVRELKNKVMEISKRLDEFYTALYQIQDYIRQKDKSWFQIEAQIRKLTFEVEQARNLRSRIPRTWSAANTDEPAFEQVQDSKAEIKAEQPSVQDISANIENEVPANDDSLLRKTHLKNVDTGSGEIQLGNVSILINPEEEPDAY